MTTINFDASIDDDSRRRRLFDGELFVYSPRAASLAMCALAREMASSAFAPRDPRTAQHEMPVEQFAAVLADLKPRFIHHPRCKELLQDLLIDLGCDPDQTYFDVPRLRTSTSDDFLSSGISYAFHPHRDTWYSAPACQVNFWFPVYDVTPDNVMALHLPYWNRALRNGSRDYNYAEWNRVSRKAAAQQIGKDTRKQPRPEEEVELDPQLRIVMPVGSLLLFSAAHLHSTVPNTSGTTRFSIDFRTVHIADVEQRRGAPNVDSECTGTSMGDYLRIRDLAHIPAALISAYDTPPLAPATQQSR
ncbi:MAG: hypothetical protein U1F41_16020 [Burkholderiales bacterium]